MASSAEVATLRSQGRLHCNPCCAHLLVSLGGHKLSYNTSKASIIVHLSSAVSCYIALLLSLFLLVYHSLQLVKMNPNHQDWDTVVIRKKAPTTSALKDEGAVNAARRTGAAVETVKKFTAGSNKVNLGTATTTGKSAVKLEAETEDFRRKRLLVSALKHGHAYCA